MTAKEMDIALSVELRKLNTTATKKFLPEEKQYYLNKAQERFISSKVRKKPDSFQYDVIDAEAVDKLIVLGSEIPITNNKFTLPKELDYFVRGSIKTSCGLIPVNLLKGFSVDQVNNTPFYKSSLKKWNGELADNVITIYPHKNTVTYTNALVTYIRKPSLINISSQKDCELRAIYHQEIVELAVSLMKTDNVSPDSQLKEAEIKRNSVKLA